jgi:hypothetical protein
LHGRQQARAYVGVQQNQQKQDGKYSATRHGGFRENSVNLAYME